MVKTYNRIQEKIKIEFQSQPCNYHMYEELIIFPALVTLKNLNTQEKSTYNQISFYHFCHKISLNLEKKQLLRNFFCIYIIFQMFITHEKIVHLHTSSYMLIKPYFTLFWKYLLYRKNICTIK